MHTRSVCEEFMSGSETEKIVEKLFRSLLQRYQDNLNEKMMDLTSNLQNGLTIKNV